MENYLIDHNYFLPFPELNMDNHLIDHNYFLPFPELNLLHDSDSESGLDADSEDEVNVNENANAPPIRDEPINLQVADTYETQPGVHLKSLIYVDNLGYRYYQNVRKNNKIYLICQYRKTLEVLCPAKAIVSTNINDRQITTSVRHNHIPPVVDVAKNQLRRSIGLAGTCSRRTTNSIRQIYNREIVSNPDGAFNYTCLQAQRCVSKMRLWRRPVNPDSIESFADILNQPINESYATTLQTPSSRFFQGLIEAEGETVGAIFYNVEAITKYQEELMTVTIAGVDGTFKTVPKRPPQFTKGCLLTFQVLYKNASFPMVYALTSRKTQETYEAFFRIVRRILPLNFVQLTVITDFERGLMNAVNIVLPECQLQTCWFHYSQAVIRYCRRTLNDVYHLFQRIPEANRVLHMVLALPHLPSEEHRDCRFTMFDGFQSIVEYVNRDVEIAQSLHVFLFGYIQNYWFNEIGAANISVFGSDIRTNNYVESFHATLLSQIGYHPNIWDYLSK